jgi:hypothetical protein
MKMFRTISIKTVEECQVYLNFIPFRFLIDIRKVKFLENICKSSNSICSNAVALKAREELANICSSHAVTDHYMLKTKIYTSFWGPN